MSDQPNLVDPDSVCLKKKKTNIFGIEETIDNMTLVI